MKRFTHFNVKTVDEAATLLGKYKKGEAKLNAGGTDLMTVLKANFQQVYPTAIINLKSISGLDYIREDGGTLKIGALAKLSDIASSSVVKGSWSMLAEAAFNVATPQIRNLATIGGNLCQETRCWYYRAPKAVGKTFLCLRKGGTVCFAVTGDNRHHAILGGAGCFNVCPSDTAIALTALNATIVTNKRSIPVGNFFQVLGTALATDEIVTEVQVPKPAAGTKQSFTKFRQRKTMDFAVVSVASVITVSGGNVSDARIALGGVSPVPYRATGAENAIKGKAITETLAGEAGAAAVKDAVALSHNSYKIQIAKTLVSRAIMA